MTEKLGSVTVEELKALQAAVPDVGMFGMAAICTIVAVQRRFGTFADLQFISVMQLLNPTFKSAPKTSK